MASWVDYRGMQVPDSSTGDAGIRLTDNFTELAERAAPVNFTATTDPDANDDVDSGFYPGSLWLNTSTPLMWICVDNSSGAAIWQAPTGFSTVVDGAIYGLTLSNDGTSPNTAVDVAIGSAADSTNANLIRLGSAFTKVIQSSGSWTAGTGNNGLDTGARAASTWHHVFLIRKDADGSADILFSTSVSSPSLPSGYSTFRRIGSVKTDGSSNIIRFTQFGDEFIWYDAAYDVQAVTTLGTTTTLYTLSVPLGLNVLARIRTTIRNNSGNAVQYTIRSPAEDSSQNTTFASGSGHAIYAMATDNPSNAELLVRTNTSSQVAAITNSASNNTINVRTVGWFDDRGRL